MEPINKTQTWDERATDLIEITKPCLWCKGNTVIKASKFLMNKWAVGTNMQEVWPHVALDDREAMITGYHSECFDEMFKGDDDE